MTKKEAEEKKIDKVDEAPSEKKDAKTEEVSKPKKQPKTSKKRDTVEVEYGTIIDCINELDDHTDLFLRLSMCNYLGQYENELKYRELGYDIKPYIDKNEFFKKMK